METEPRPVAARRPSGPSPFDDLPERAIGTLTAFLVDVVVELNGARVPMLRELPAQAQTTGVAIDLGPFQHRRFRPPPTGEVREAGEIGEVRCELGDDSLEPVGRDESLTDVVFS